MLNWLTWLSPSQDRSQAAAAMSSSSSSSSDSDSNSDSSRSIASSSSIGLSEIEAEAEAEASQKASAGVANSDAPTERPRPTLAAKAPRSATKLPRAAAEEDGGKAAASPLKKRVVEAAKAGEAGKDSGEVGDGGSGSDADEHDGEKDDDVPLAKKRGRPRKNEAKGAIAATAANDAKAARPPKAAKEVKVPKLPKLPEEASSVAAEKKGAKGKAAKQKGGKATADMAAKADVPASQVEFSSRPMSQRPVAAAGNAQGGKGYGAEKEPGVSVEAPAKNDPPPSSQLASSGRSRQRKADVEASLAEALAMQDTAKTGPEKALKGKKKKKVVDSAAAGNKPEAVALESGAAPASEVVAAAAAKPGGASGGILNRKERRALGAAAKAIQSLGIQPRNLNGSAFATASEIGGTGAPECPTAMDVVETEIAPVLPVAESAGTNANAPVPDQSRGDGAATTGSAMNKGGRKRKSSEDAVPVAEKRARGNGGAAADSVAEGETAGEPDPMLGVMRICFEMESANAYQEFAASRKRAEEELEAARRAANEQMAASCRTAQEKFELACNSADETLAARIGAAFDVSCGKAASALGLRRASAGRTKIEPPLTSNVRSMSPPEEADASNLDMTGRRGRPPQSAEKKVLKDATAALVLSVIEKNEAADGLSKEEVMAKTGKGRTIVKNRLKHLVENGVIAEEAVADKTLYRLVKR
jgi:hypothetical protein